MVQLLKLELERNKIKPYLIASLCIFVVVLGFCFLTAFIPRIEQATQITEMTGGVSISAQLDLLRDWNSYMFLVSALFVASFGVMSAVMHAKFTVEEYTGKKANLLFSYPVKRSELLFVKCSFVFFFTIVAAALCNIVTLALFAFISNSFKIMPTLFTLDMVSNLVYTALISSLLAAAIGLVAMRIGFWRKSLITTVVSSIILFIPFGNMMSMMPDSSQLIRLIGMGGLLLLGVLVFLELLSKVNKMEAL